VASYLELVIDRDFMETFIAARYLEESKIRDRNSE